MDLEPTWILALSGILFLLSFGAFLKARPRMPRRSLASQVKLLAKVPVLGSLAPDHIQRFAKVMRELLVPANVYIIRENRAGESMFFILSGQLAILKRGAHEDTLVQTVGPGDLIGEMALLTGARRIASARTMTPCHLLQIDRDDFLDLINANQDVMAAVWHACEVHSIGLAMADHQTTRSIALADRERWIATREVVVTKVDQKLTPPYDGFMAVVAGSVSTGGRVLEAPALVRVTSKDVVTTHQDGRICWLPALG